MASPERLVPGGRPGGWPGDLAVLSLLGFGLGFASFAAAAAGREQSKLNHLQLLAMLKGVQLPDDLRAYCCHGVAGG